MNVKEKNHRESIEIDRISGVSRKQFETKMMRFQARAKSKGKGNTKYKETN